MAMDSKSIDIEIWQLERTETPEIDEWGRCIVAASSEKAARQIANEDSKAEGYVWTDGHKVNATRLGIADDGVSGLLMFSRDMKE